MSTIFRVFGGVLGFAGTKFSYLNLVGKKKEMPEEKDQALSGNRTCDLEGAPQEPNL